ncbi:RIO1 family regulatory kinase/ATPase [Haladaptatus sp. T7]|uniref:RIO1 family regulatory kinase/ATPase domain-containing protein n=1 Tax=Haladaptatus sp. T7 TaxID=2029368 RepID=UPI0021A25A24|nr:RIO1 family regulatory kinase/ATPase [Haladaptatus sp. T7]GKZ12698.1 aminoglycoside phosphotransferase [Haladaptatus sp. T7]
MGIRRLVRGTIEWPRIEAVIREIAERYDREEVRVEFIDADNWLSTPCVVDDEWFVKITTGQNSLVHALFTSARNLGAFTSGTEGFFEHFAGPEEMAEHELEATRKMREIGLNVPAPIESFEYDDLGVLVMEYLPDFETFEQMPETEVRAYAPNLFAALSRMHENNLAHGDLRGENVLVANGEIYFIDATSVNGERIDEARSYDLACALASLTPLIGARDAVVAAREHYTAEELLAAREFLDFVNIRPDHDFDAASAKGEIEKLAETEDREEREAS